MHETYEKLIQGLLEKGYESVDCWFTEGELSGLRKSLLCQYENDNFHTAGIGKNEYHQQVLKIRNDQVHWLYRSEADEHESVFFEKMDGFISYLNRTCFAGIMDSEFHYAVYEKGAFFKKHVDVFKNDNRRQFSFVGYLTESWMPGDGGELLLYPNDEPVKIEPSPGKVLFFKSDLPHEVLPANAQRLSLTGWLKTTGIIL